MEVSGKDTGELPHSFSGDRPDPGMKPGLLHCGQIVYNLTVQVCTVFYIIKAFMMLLKCCKQETQQAWQVSFRAVNRTVVFPVMETLSTVAAWEPPPNNLCHQHIAGLAVTELFGSGVHSLFGAQCSFSLSTYVFDLGIRNLESWLIRLHSR